MCWGRRGEWLEESLLFCLSSKGWVIKWYRVTEITFLEKKNWYVFHKDHYFVKPLIYTGIHDIKSIGNVLLSGIPNQFIIQEMFFFPVQPRVEPRHRETSAVPFFHGVSHNVRTSVSGCTSVQEVLGKGENTWNNYDEKGSSCRWRR